ncbi:hypothetical protein [Streptomyces sp. RKAG337]|uniref:hypothetical protein n=1 Tax=Streptomyces sp. RKAG337 TaxID=2893404 RepID=UPI00203389B1|nr:hypothetical protein [Streptomyces sp. RKAG337]MCM2424304.1 hypothetical protein [Streptomyces sp. RKAG337]
MLTGVDPATIGRLLRYDVLEALSTASPRARSRCRLQGGAGRLARGQTLSLQRQDDQRGSVTIGAVYHADEQSDLLPSITAPDSLVARYDSTPNTAAVLVATDGGPGRAALGTITHPSATTRPWPSSIKQPSGPRAAAPSATNSTSSTPCSAWPW